ncbi:MAG TPA: glycosyltransferase family 39 protein [Leptolyngbyaceae cyanobacterium M33_DOE_097]|uniref:Glycosyltransferase family 39 protein n=1 Tax=Oscillatoriales cyanobacterium SpSt-418 TaxID=2282169 RepID=A0A7C3PHM1_9CYAN|nr:glycosyltransferase family 39 protein [Leptolyngbyaceae cyanobacterium M33_DOE_097]
MQKQVIQWLRSDTAILWWLAFIKLMLHFLTNGQYGYHTDELYYMAAGDRLAWGYVEFPPLVAVLAHISHSLTGDSLFSIRLFPAIAGALLVFVTGLMTRELGGSRYAQFLAALLVIVSPYFLVMHTILTMNAFEPLIWTVCAYLILLALKYHRPRLWLLVGVLIGVGLLNKFSILFFGVSTLVGLWMTRRQVFTKKWIWLGLIAAIALAMPTVIWQIQHGLPFLEHQRAAALHSKKPFPASIIALLVQPLLMMHPLTTPIWLAGLFYFLKSKDGKPYRLLGWIFVITYGLFLLLQGKSYYLAPLFPTLFAGGAIAVDRWIWGRRRFRLLIPGVLAASTILFVMPMTLPILPIETLLRISSYYSSVYFVPDRAKVTITEREVPSPFRDMLGWEDSVAQVSQVYHQLPLKDQAQTAILSWRYADAGAIDFYGSRYGLPKGISGAHNFYFWGYQNNSGQSVISLGGDRDYLEQLFDQVEQVSTVTHNTVIGIKSYIPIYLCKDIKVPFNQSWPNFKAYFGYPVAFNQGTLR